MAVDSILPPSLTQAVEGLLRTTELDELRRLGRFDEHGDPLDPVVRLERYAG